MDLSNNLESQSGLENSLVLMFCPRVQWHRKSCPSASSPTPSQLTWVCIYHEGLCTHMWTPQPARPCLFHIPSCKQPPLGHPPGPRVSTRVEGFTPQRCIQGVGPSGAWMQAGVQVRRSLCLGTLNMGVISDTVMEPLSCKPVTLWWDRYRQKKAERSPLKAETLLP